MTSNLKSEVLITSDSCGQMANLLIYDPENGSLLTSFKGFTSGQGTACIMANTFVVSSNPSKPLLNVWPVWKGEQRPVKQTLPGIATALAVSNDAHGAVVAVAVNEVIYIWMSASGELANVISSGGHYQKVTGMSFTPDSSHLVSVGADGNVLVWTTANLVGCGSGQAAPKPLRTWSDHSLEVTGHAVTASRVYTCSLDQTAKVHELASGDLLLDVTFAVPLTAIAVDSLEANVYVGSKNGDIHTFSLRSPPRDLNMTVKPDKTNTYKGHTKPVKCLSVSVSGHIMASGSDDFDVRIWDIKSGLSLRTLSHKGAMTNVKFQPVVPGLLGDTGENRANCKPGATLLPFNKTPSEDSVIELVVRDQVPSVEQEDFYSCESAFPHPAASFVLPDSASATNSSQSVTEMPEVTKLKDINLQLYQHALKNILSKQN